ncbi:hypothetical protein ACHAW5_003690 [Stephanodiscus triporus]|uniref:Uncharacterized protein n=1 Tax=Stephanodiscus triporus TaxID=2934178 RepID=A0ABD3QIV4_9STRA
MPRVRQMQGWKAKPLKITFPELATKAAPKTLNCLPEYECLRDDVRELAIVPLILSSKSPGQKAPSQGVSHRESLFFIKRFINLSSIIMDYDPLGDVELEIPDIGWDIARYETNQPTESNQPTPHPPSFDPTPVPSPSPSSDTHSSTATPTESLSPSPSTTNVSETSTSSSSTYYSCPPPPAKTVQHGTTIVKVEPSISIVRIPYGFQVQTSENEDVITILPNIENQIEATLGEYMKSNTEDGYDENLCKGYDVEDFRLRKLNNAVSTLEDAPTKIIAISRAKGMFVDENYKCEPHNENCHLIYGELDATYVGNNEAGVKSSISRVIKDVVVDQVKYDIQYKEVDDESYGYKSPDISNEIPVIVSSAQEATPESIIKSSRLTPYGLGILVALSSTFIVLCFVFFIKDGGSKKRKNAKRENKYAKREMNNAKRKALGEGDDSKQSDEHSYCYDLENVEIDHEMNIEEDVEVKNTRKYGSANAATATAAVAADCVDSSRESRKTKKWWNKTDDSAKVAAAATVAVDSVDRTKKWWDKSDDSAKVATVAAARTTTTTVESVDGSYFSSKTKKVSNKEVDSLKLDSLVSVETVDEESSRSDSEQGPMAVHPSERATGIQFLPSLPNFLKGSTPLVDRLPSNLCESRVSVDESTATQKSSSLSHGVTTDFRSRSSSSRDGYTSCSFSPTTQESFAFWFYPLLYA